MSFIAIGNNQKRVRDCYASAPLLDLTLRSNGEEKTMVMDSLGQFVPAGFDPPTAVATVANNATPAGLTTGKRVAYRYVYAATRRYPFVENAVTAGGSEAPRSNPSPSSAELVTNGNHVTVTVTKSTRVDITQIWVYRTDYYDNAGDALDAADAGLLHYVGFVGNDGIPGTITFDDGEVTVEGNEQIETDNFPAPTFRQCVYAEPFFYGFANDERIDEIVLDATGLMTQVDTTHEWYDGRDGQVVTLQGLTSGGFDGYGSFYFKRVTSSTAQLYLDLQLTQIGTPDSTGTTRAKIEGQSTILYRSKERNPFSWGFTEAVGDINVPQPYAFKVGGGHGTAMAVVPVLNLLKLDTEAPTKTYTLNLAGAGTPAFEESRRIVSEEFSSSGQFSQFVSRDESGNTFLWFFDSKTRIICVTDGTQSNEISGKVFDFFDALQYSQENAEDVVGIYDPNTQCSLLWFSEEGGVVRNDITLAYHHPTKTWSTLSIPGVLCTAQVYDKVTRKVFLFMGTEVGQIGNFDPESTVFFAANNINATVTTKIGDTTFQSNTSFELFDRKYLIGTWVVFYRNTGTQTIVGTGRIVEHIIVMGTSQFTIEHGSLDAMLGFEPPTNFNFILGGIYAFASKILSLGQPFNKKKVTDIHAVFSTVTIGDHQPYLSVIQNDTSVIGVPELETFHSWTHDQKLDVGHSMQSMYVKNPFKEDQQLSADMTFHFLAQGTTPLRFSSFGLALDNA